MVFRVLGFSVQGFRVQGLGVLVFRVSFVVYIGAWTTGFFVPLVEISENISLLYKDDSSKAVAYSPYKQN